MSPAVSLCGRNEDMQEITGTVVNKIYEAEDGYAVLEIEGETPAVVVGNLSGLKPGEVARFFGAFKTHNKFGQQFSVSSYESVLPSDLNDIILFLSGGFIKGLGEVLATRIVEEFRDETFGIIENNPMRLTSIKGISKRLANEVHAALSEYAQIKEVYAELMGMGLTAHQARVVEKEMGQDAPRILRENPYLLIDRVHGMDFMTADKLARGMGIQKDSPFRVKNGILNVLKKMLANGNMYVIRDRLVPHVAQRLDIQEGVVRNALLSLALEETVVLRTYLPDMETVFLSSAYHVEMKAAAKLFAMSASTARTKIKNVEELLAKRRKEFSLTDEQAEAVRAAVSTRVCGITGGPGTGKTTILKAVLQILGAAGISCALAAPTGRAAKRMQEATGEQARTLHRLLEYSYDEDAYQCYFRRNEENPLEEGAIIVDEVSMLDIFLFNNLLEAVPEGSRLILVGDADQLPSVGPGNVMRDILSSQAVPSVRLTYRFRNAGKIADAAYEILQGEIPEEDDAEFMFVECASQSQGAEAVRLAYLDYVRKGADVQVIAPVKRTEMGTLALNAMLRDTVNPPKPGKAEIMHGDRIFREGDRVMQVKNNYARKWEDHKDLGFGEGVFNGDIGVITHIAAGTVTVRFEDGKVSRYDLMDLSELDGAFAYTIHKSQGSEFDVVIIPMLYNPHPFFTRNLLYTGVTRAKKEVLLIGDRYTLRYMVGNGAKNTRATALSKELKYLSRVVEA